MFKSDNPTPEQRAEVVIRRLEMFIREGRSPQGGMSFRRWQDMARVELISAFLDWEKTWRADDLFMNRALVVGASAVVTIGFWGTVMALGRGPEHLNEGLILFAGGMVLFATAGAVGIRKLWKRRQANVREERMGRVISLDRKLKALDKDLEKRVKDLEESVEEMGRIQG